MARFQAQLTNPKTNEYILLTSNDRNTLLSKIERKKAQWEKQNARLEMIETKEKAIENAAQLTKDAQSEIDEFNSILAATLDVDDKIDWESLKDTKSFKRYVADNEPKWDDYAIEIKKYGVLEAIPFFKNKRAASEKKTKEKFDKEMLSHKQNEQKKKEQYDKEKVNYETQQKEYNQSLDVMKDNYEKYNPDYVVKYFDLVLERSEYPESLELSSKVYYEPNSKILLVDMDLPNIDKVPSVKEVKYNTSKKEQVEIEMGQKEFEEFYNNIIYQIALRTIHEMFEADYANSIDIIVFNGWVDGIDTKTGKQFRNCIVSLQISKNEFINEIDLEQINLIKSFRDCFRHLKGISAGSLIHLAPVRPIMVMNEKDKRFIQADNVSDMLGQDTNLASMDWQDFEVLVRDLIQKEFSNEGCKVEVTRASRDAGVDAIAFDQDPIRGGKYIIQAKRYNNLVPVSAVRDLYGTVLNEGGVKGILITTSYYGKDAIDFANNKPLKLINGEELLFMFNKYGYKFRIDLAKKGKAVSNHSY